MFVFKYICSNSRFLCAFLYPCRLKCPLFLVGRSIVNFYSQQAPADDVSDRFRHVRGKLKDLSHEFDHNLYFGSNTSAREGEASQGSDHSLEDYSLEHVESALMQFVPEYISTAKDDGNNTFMTPGQAFFLENREKLMETVRKRYQEERSKQRGEVAEVPEDEETLDYLMEHDFNEESFGSYGSEHFPERDKEHLWDYNTDSVSVAREPIELTKGVMPTIQQILHILEQESIVDPSVVDMNRCERRDQGLYVIVATGTTSTHCRRVGRLLYNLVIDLEIPFVSKVTYCSSSRNEEWIIAHLGPLSVHLMTKEIRNKYSLEEFWSEHFSSRGGPSQERLAE